LGKCHSQFVGYRRWLLSSDLDNRDENHPMAVRVNSLWIYTRPGTLPKPWEDDLNFFPLSGLSRTLVRKLNLLLVERGTGLEPATSTLGNSSKRPLLSARLGRLSSTVAHAFGLVSAPARLFPSWIGPRIGPRTGSP